MSRKEANGVQVKICGLTDVADTRLAIELGADLIGLNFFAGSPRYLEPGRAAELVQAVEAELEGDRRRVRWVGVFVNEQVERAARIAGQVGLDLLQFHGDETPEQIAPIADRAIKALRVRGDLSPALLDPWRELGLWGLLVDARHETLYGGSGRSWNVESLPAALGAGGDVRVLVAGGLEPSNVAAAVRASRPWGVDLCSGVEAAPGRKEAGLMKQLFAELAGLEALERDPAAPSLQDTHRRFSPDEEIPHGQTPPAA